MRKAKLKFKKFKLNVKKKVRTYRKRKEDFKKVNRNRYV